jgi:hypothetical protein
MLVSFAGKGCKNCPFYYINDKGDWHECWLHERRLNDGTRVSINEGRNLFVGDTPTEWPPGCPFGELPGTIQVEAQEGNC